MNKLGKKTKFLFIFSIGFLVIWCLFYFLGFRIVRSHSMPPGIYRYVPGEPVRGQFVAFHLDKRWSELVLARDYLDYGFLHLREQPTIKHVAASEGDKVKVDEMGIWVNDSLLDLSAPMKADSKGRPMPESFLDKVILKKGEFLAVSNHRPDGLDSRYYGILDGKNLVSRVIPIYYF